MISIDVDVAHEVGKLPNASKLINTLLRHHFGSKLKRNCPHDWSNAFGTAEGLVKECKLCHKFEKVDYK